MARAFLFSVQVLFRTTMSWKLGHPSSIAGAHDHCDDISELDVPENILKPQRIASFNGTIWEYDD